MFKHDTMEQYVTDREPRLAPRAPRRPTPGLADIARDARERAVDALTRPVAPIININTLRVPASTAPVPA